MTYHVLPIGLTVLVLYIFSLYLSSQGFTARLSHRRFWNWILLVSFLVTGLFGIFLTLRINYRWELSFAESLRHWHVETGIAMVLAALIHLSWHLGYYFSKKSRNAGNQSARESAGKSSPEPTAAGKSSPEPTAAGKSSADIAAGRFRPLLLLTGFVSSSSQFILMREAVILGGGTEAVTGLFLWLWLIISAAGALAGGRSGITSLRKMIWTLIACTALAPLLLISISTIILSPGQTPSFYQTLAIMGTCVAPVTFISALIFVRISVIRYNMDLADSGHSFGAETAGSVTAGILTALTVTVRIPNFQLYLLILLLAVVTAVWLLERNVHLKIPAIIIAVLLGAVLFIKPPDPFIRSKLLRGVRAEKSTDTPYGNITTGLYGGELTVYYHHRPLFYPGDVISSEENIHYALLQRDSYDRVLLISGGLKKHLDELVKHPIAAVDYLELDPGLIAAEEARDTVCGTMKVRVISSDPMTFIRENDYIYDAVIQLIPPPSTLSVSRFYTVEYFRMVREHLSPEGVFMCTPMPWFNYSPESYRRGFSPLFNALSSVFSHITLIPGSMLYVIASESPVSPEIAQMAGQKGMINSYVNTDYLDDHEIRLKEEQILSQVDRRAGMNRATRPVSSLFANMLSLEKMGMRGGIITLLTVLIAIPFLFAARRGLLMFASSAGLAGYGMIMIFILQMAVGNIYILSAVILTLLMAGLATGAVLGERLALKKISLCTLLLTAIFVLTGLLAPALVTSPPGLVIVFLFIALPVSGIITGAVYRILTSRDSGMVTGKVYSADMAGSALGYLTAATLLVPLAGTANSCFILAALILISGTVASLTIKQ
jgi:spermidine synthase